MERVSYRNGNQDQQLCYKMVKNTIPSQFSQGCVYSDKTQAEMIHFNFLLCLKWKCLNLTLA